MIDFNRVAAKTVFDTKVAERACSAERKTARALGADWAEAYAASYRVLDEILDLARAPMPALVLTRFRPCR